MANSGYVYLTSQEIEILKNATKTSKSSSLRNLVDNVLITLDKQSLNDNSKFITAAEAKFGKLKFEFNETFIIEEDANVSVNADGAYVQAWLWVDNTDIKTKKTTRSRKAVS
jgi:hypothetical protein